MTNKEIAKYSPLTEATYYILISLVEPIHGYGIIKQVEDMSDGRIRLAAGTLYGAINTLEKNKFIEPMGVDPNNSRRKLYKMTEKGRLLALYELKRIREMLDAGEQLLGGQL